MLVDAAIASPSTTQRVSLDSAGNQANGASPNAPDINADARFVAFESAASNLVPGDSNFCGPGPVDPGTCPDVFVHDRQTGETTRVSVDSAGNEGALGATSPTISGDGRFVAFRSESALVPGDTNGVNDIFVHDRQLGTTERVSVTSGGVQADSFSADPAISGDGLYVAFVSAADNLVPNDTNGTSDIFVHDRLTGTTTRVSVASDGTQGDRQADDAAISADGRYVAFDSGSTNLVPEKTNPCRDVFVRDLQSGTTERVSITSDGTEGDIDPLTGCDSLWPALSADGRLVAFTSSTHLTAGDGNNSFDVFVRDRLLGTTAMVSVSSSGEQGNGGHSNGGSRIPSLSADGRFVALDSQSNNLVSGDTNVATDIFVHDRLLSTTTRLSVASTGAQANGESFVPAISADGRVVTFVSLANSLVPGDSNGVADVFVHDLGPTPTPIPSPIAVGGIVELRDDPNAQRDQPASSGSVSLPASVAVGLLVMGAGGLYVVRMRRLWLSGRRPEGTGER